MDIMDWTPLMHATRSGDLDTVQRLLKSKEKIHVKNKMGADVLMLSAASGNKAVFKVILEEMNNASPDNTMDLSCVLRIAALFGHTDIVQFLLHSKCDPNTKDPMSGVTALMLATSCGHFSVVRLLLSYGALVDTTNAFCQSALDIAESKHYNDIVELLTSKVTYDRKKLLPDFFMSLELPKIEYKVRELGTVSCSTNFHRKRATSPAADRFSCSAEELLSPHNVSIPEFSNICQLSPTTLLPISDCETFSPGNCKKTVDDMMTQISSPSSKDMGTGCSSNDLYKCLSPYNYHFTKKFDILKKQEFSREVNKSIQEEKLEDNFKLSAYKMFQYNSSSQSNSPYSPSPTSRNVFSRSDPSVIHELNGGTERQKGRKKAFWHGIRRRVRSLAHDKSGYHFFHPYCDSAVSQKSTVSSPHILISDDLKFKAIEANSEEEGEDYSCKIVVSPLSYSLEYEKRCKSAPKPVQEARPVQCGFKEFLCANGLHHFIDLFFEHELDLMTFFELRDIDLREIGISNTEDRKKILNVIASQSHCYV